MAGGAGILLAGGTLIGGGISIFPAGMPAIGAGQAVIGLGLVVTGADKRVSYFDAVNTMENRMKHISSSP